MELFSQVVVMGGWLLSVLVKEGSKGTFSIAARVSSSTCARSGVDDMQGAERCLRRERQLWSMVMGC